MWNYRVCFYKTVLNSSGHSFKCLQQKIDISSETPSGALVLAERQLEHELTGIDSVEVHSIPAHDLSGAKAR